MSTKPLLSFEEDRDLLLLLSTVGINFLDHTYDIVPGNGGFGLRTLKGDNLVDFKVCPTEASLLTELRSDLEQAMYDYILGRWKSEPSWRHLK